MRTARQWLQRHPRWADAGAVAVVVVVEQPGTAGYVVGVGPWLVFATVHLPLMWRRRWPVPVFWAVFGVAVLAGAVVSMPVKGLYPEAAVLLGLYPVARHAPRRQLWPALAAIEVPAVAVLLLDGPNWLSLGVVTSALAVTAMLGVTAGTRHAYLAELEDRALRLERERHQQARLAVAAERTRIARELHDIVAHNLSVMVALADGAARTVPSSPERAAEVMRQAARTGREALGEMRRLLDVLDSDRAGRTPQPGLADLDALVDQVRVAGLPVAMTRHGTPSGWGPGAQVAVYRIVQEALTNAMKHAGPGARAAVRLDVVDGGLDLEITDDGAGTSARAAPEEPGRGLVGMTQRAAAYGALLEAGPRTDGPGWRVRVRLSTATTGEPA